MGKGPPPGYYKLIYSHGARFSSIFKYTRRRALSMVAAKKRQLAGRRFVEQKYDIKKLNNQLAGRYEELLRA